MRGKICYINKVLNPRAIPSDSIKFHGTDVMQTRQSDTILHERLPNPWIAMGNTVNLHPFNLTLDCSPVNKVIIKMVFPFKIIAQSILIKIRIAEQVKVYADTVP